MQFNNDYPMAMYRLTLYLLDGQNYMKYLRKTLDLTLSTR